MYNFVYSETIDIPSPPPPVDMFIIQPILRKRSIGKLSNIKLIDNTNVQY